MLFKCRVGHSSIFCFIDNIVYSRFRHNAVVSSTFSAVGTGTIGLGTVEAGAVACESTGVGKLCKVEWEVLAVALK